MEISECYFYIDSLVCVAISDRSLVQVITFAAAAVEAMHADGMNVLIEGRAQASASAPS